MNIRFISSLTSEDEDAFASALLKAASAFLAQAPIAYTLRIETTGARVFQCTNTRVDDGRVVELDRPSRVAAGRD